MGAGHNRLVLFAHDGRDVGPRRGHLGPDAVAHRPRLPDRRPRRPARVLGRGRRRAALACCTSSRGASPRERRRRHRRQRPERARRRDPPRRGGALRRPSSRRPTAPGGAVRTEELTLPGFRHDTFSSVYPGRRRVAGVRADAARRATACAGCTRRRARRTRCPTAARSRCTATSTPRPRASTAVARATASAGARSSRRCSTPSTAVRATMLGGFPPLARPAAPARAPGLPRHAALRRARPRRRRAGSAGACSRTASARAWLYGAAGARRRAADARRAARSPPSTSTSWATRSAGRAREGGAERLTDALVGYLRGARRHGAHERAVVERVIAVARGRVTGVRARRRRARRAPTSWSPTSCRTRSSRLAGDALPAVYRAVAAPLPLRPGDVKVDWALDGPIPWALAGGRAAPGRSTSAAARTRCSRRSTRAARRPARAAVPAARPADASPTRRARRPGKHTAWAYTHGPQHGVDWAASADAHVERMEAQVERYAPGFRDRILARHVLGPGRPRGAATQPRRRRRRRRQLPARPGRLPPDPVALALPHAGARPVPRQRRDVPRRRGPRRAGRRGGAGGAGGCGVAAG